MCGLESLGILFRVFSREAVWSELCLSLLFLQLCG